MAMTPRKILLFIAGLFGAGLATAYYGGVFDGSHAPAVVQDASVPDSAASAPAATVPADPAPVASEQVDAASPAPQAPASGADSDAGATSTGETSGAEQAGSPEASGEIEQHQAVDVEGEDVIIPSFDLLRVESDGSLVIAGQAAANSSVEIVAGSSVLATATSGSNGDFAAVLDRALKPGEHTVVLRSRSQQNVAATSLETAIVSVPSSREGDVVALVQQPGQPSRLISVPEATAVARQEPENGDATTGEVGETLARPRDTIEPGTGDAANGADSSSLAQSKNQEEPQEPSTARAPQDVEDPSEAPEVATRQPAEPDPEAEQQPVQQSGQQKPASPFIEAVEIDGRKVFVAGRAEAGKRVRVYVNDVLLGQAGVDANGRFLIETERDLPVGDYIVRADVLGSDGLSVTSRAAVPFARQAGESMTSVATDSGAATEQGAEGPEQMAPALQRADGAVIIRKGDTLWHISRRVYGQGIRYTTIYKANQDQIRDPDLIWPGQTFSLPAASNEGEPADLSSIMPAESVEPSSN